MAGGDWWNAPRPAALERRGRTGGQMTRGIVGGFITAILFAVAALLWNSYSKGGLIHVLGGATSEELIAEAAKHPGPQGPAGPPGNPGPAGTLSFSMTIQSPQDFDKSGSIPGSEAASLCTLSKIVLHRYVAHPDRSCELSPGAQRNDPWQIVVNGAVCGVTCFTVGPKK
jgi:hypothetical protein